MQKRNEERLLDVADKLAVTEVTYTYSDCVDRRGFEGVLKRFHPDAAYQYQKDGTPLPVAEFF